jgi:hypothetical protein
MNWLTIQPTTNPAPTATITEVPNAVVSTSTVAALAPRAKITGTVATGAIGLQLLKLKIQLLLPLFANKNMVSTSTPSNPVIRRRSPDNAFQRSRSLDRTEALDDSSDEAIFFA